MMRKRDRSGASRVSQVTTAPQPRLGKQAMTVLSVVLLMVLLGCTSTVNLREVCPDGQSLTYQGREVGCIYDADSAHERVDEICPEKNTAYRSVIFGTQVPETLGGGRSGCLVCIHEDHAVANTAIEPGGLYAEGFRPGIGCLGYFRFKPR